MYIDRRASYDENGKCVYFTLEQAMNAQRGSRSRIIALLFFSLGAGKGRVINATPRLLFPRETAPVPVLQEAV